MNNLRPHREVAFFLLTKSPSADNTIITEEAVTRRLWLLQQPGPDQGGWQDYASAQDEVDDFYQCLAFFSRLPAVDINAHQWWWRLERSWLAHKVSSYYSHLRDICKAEDVYFREQQRKGVLIKFPWCLHMTQVAPDRDRMNGIAVACLDGINTPGSPLAQQRCAAIAAVDPAVSARLLKQLIPAHVRQQQQPLRLQ